jgi:hypothetical protein
MIREERYYKKEDKDREEYYNFVFSISNVKNLVLYHSSCFERSFIRDHYHHVEGAKDFKTTQNFQAPLVRAIHYF